MFGRSSPGYDRLLEKATSHLLLEPDWDSILSICDCIRQGDVQSKYVLSSVKKKVTSENPHVAMFALEVLESVVKNCGSSIHQELATKEFMEFIKDTITVRGDPVKGKLLELVQTWAHAFRNEASYKAVLDTFHLLKMEGHTFPTLKEADAMFLSEKAPEWKDGECCHRCRVQFTMVQRKHHCRNCGQVFCSKCSSKNSIIPRFGIEREVRVCETCFDTLNKAAGAKNPTGEDLPSEYLNSPLAQQSQLPPTRSEAELQEEEELQLAIALSKSEAENKGKERDRVRNILYGSPTGSDTRPEADPIYANPTKLTAPMMDTSEMDPELARYLNRNYWEQKQDDGKLSGTLPSAPPGGSTDSSAEMNGERAPPTAKVAESFQNGEVGEDDAQFLSALSSSIEIFCNRMRSNSQRGRSVANDSSVQTLFMTINAMHPRLVKHLQKQEEARAHFEGLQDKLAQLKDAREALDSLREEHREKRRREMEELERQRQIAMAQKLEVMRQKKQEYLEYQRQLALQRMQEQEREMALRLEQQKQMQQMRVMQQYGYTQPQGPPQMYGQQAFSPGGSLEGSPLHHPHPQQTYYQSQDNPQAHLPGTGPPGAGPPGAAGPMGPVGGPSMYNAPGGFPPQTAYQPTTQYPQPVMGGESGQFQPPAGQSQMGVPPQPPQGLPIQGPPPQQGPPQQGPPQPQQGPPQPQQGPPLPQGYVPPGGMDYSQGPYMHGMAPAAPGQTPAQFQQQPDQVDQQPMAPPTGPYMSGQFQQPGPGGAMPPGAPPPAAPPAGGPPAGGPPAAGPHGSQPQQQGSHQSDLAQLISFD